MDRGVDVGPALATVDCPVPDDEPPLAGRGRRPDPLPGEQSPVDPETDEWEPAGDGYAPTAEDEDWLSQLDIREVARYQARAQADAEGRLTRFTDYDLAAAGLSAG